MKNGIIIYKKKLFIIEFLIFLILQMDSTANFRLYLVEGWYMKPKIGSTTQYKSGTIRYKSGTIRYKLGTILYKSGTIRYKSGTIQYKSGTIHWHYFCAKIRNKGG